MKKKKPFLDYILDKQSPHIEVAQGTIFVEQNMRYGLLSRFNVMD